MTTLCENSFPEIQKTKKAFQNRPFLLYIQDSSIKFKKTQFKTTSYVDVKKRNQIENF